MDFQIDQNEIAQRVTNEVLKEIEESNTTFTNDEIKEKINNKLDEIFKAYRANEDKIKRKKDEEDEWIIEKEFTDINEFGNPITKDDKFDSLLESIENEYGNEEESIEDELSEKIEENESEDKKKFIEEFADLYKNELQNSINSFKNAYESFKLMKKTSIIEKVLILLFLAVPAIFGGLLTLFFILILLLLWQIHILLKVFIKFFDRVETSIKETIAKIRKKIDTLKNSGGFFNRLIFSNSLYSLIMFNGILYMLVKGMLLPLKSAAEIDRILANLVSKGVRAATMGLRGPSELALANLRENALRSGKTALKETAKGRNKLQLRNLLKARQNLLKKNNNMVKKAEAVKIMAVKGKIAQNITTKLQAAQKDLVEQKLNALGERVDVLKVPSSVKLSNSERERMDRSDLGKMIFDNVLNGVRDRIAGMEPGREFDALGSVIDNNRGGGRPDHSVDQMRMREDLKTEATEKYQQYEKGSATFQKLGVDQDEFMKAYAENRTKMGNDSSDAFHATLEQFPNLSTEAKIDLAIATADMRNAGDDLGDLGDFKRWVENNEEATFENYLAEKFDQSKEDLNNEVQEFARRYTLNGQPADCNKLIDEAMKEHGIDKDRIMTDDEFKKVALTVAEQFPEEQRADVVKDLREHNLTYAERQRCRQELQDEKSRNASKQQETFAGKESNRRSQGGGSRELSAN